MIKKVFIYTSIYLIVILTLIFAFYDNVNLFIATVMPVSFAFIVFMFVFVFKKSIKSKPQNNHLIFSDTATINTQNLKEITTRPFLFGIENKIISDENLFYTNDELVAVNKQNEKAVFKLTEITELSRTSTIINNHKIWQIKINRENEAEIIFKFAHNYTIWNKNFPEFIERMNQINPKAVKTKFNLFSM